MQGFLNHKFKTVFLLNKDWLIQVLHICIYIIFFTPHIVKTMPIPDAIIVTLKVLLLEYSFFCVLFKRANLMLVLSLAIFLVVVFSTAFHDDSVRAVIGRYYSMLGVLFFIELNRDHIIRELKAIFYAAEILIIINAISMVLFPGGIYRGSNRALYWIIGQKQDFAIVFFAAFVFGLIFWKFQEMRKHVLIAYVAMLFSMVRAVPLGLFLSFVIIAVFLFLSRCKSVYIKGRDLLIINIIGELLIVLITYFYASMQSLQLFLTGIKFGGSVSKADNILSRINMWKDSINIMAESPIIGTGFISPDRYGLIMEHSSFHPIMHNQILDFGVTGGIIAIILFLWINIIAFRQLDLCKGRNRDILAFSLFGMNILMLTECMYWPLTFMFYLLAFYIERLNEIKESNFA